MVVASLRELQDTGLVERRVDPGPPIARTYSITTRGQQLIPDLAALWALAEQQQQSTEAGEPRRTPLTLLTSRRHATS
jgi:DNA-binding HxlR family transcriptional regulator